MTHLVHTRSGRRHRLAPTTLVGRQSSCELVLPAAAAEISRFHALLHWSSGPDAGGWSVRDLHSRNGTFVDGMRIEPGRDAPIGAHSRIAFGARDDTWTLVASGSPPIVLVGEHPDHEVRLIGRAMLLPHDDTPEAMVYHRPDCGWVLETDAGLTALDKKPTFTVAGVRWRAQVPSDSGATRGLPDAITLELRISADEEYVELVARRAGRVEPITAGSGSALYFLLTLARRRIADAERGVAVGERGWIHVAEAAEMFGCSEQALNQWVFRLRARLAAADVDEIDLIERRARTGLLRLGHADLLITAAGAPVT